MMLSLLMLMGMGVMVVEGQMSNCDTTRYLPANESCCTVLSVLPPPLGQCCKTADRACHCNPTLIGSKWGSQCQIVAPSTSAPTSAPTAAPTTTTTRTTTPMPTTTTPAVQKLCPAITSRLLNGSPVPDVCYHNGMIEISARHTTGFEITWCNGVSVFNPRTGQRELLVDGYCWDVLHTTLSNPDWRGIATSQGEEFEFSTCGMFTSTTAVSSQVSDYVVAVQHPMLSMYLDSFSNCPNVGCKLDPTTMFAAFTGQGCFLLSYGSIGQNTTSGAEIFNGLYRANVTITANSKCGFSDFEFSVTCVMLNTPQGTCAGDGSAGMFCPLTTGETVFMGILKWQGSCDKAIYAAVNTNMVVN